MLIDLPKKHIMSHLVFHISLHVIDHPILFDVGSLQVLNLSLQFFDDFLHVRI